jgi:hypothetical protein
LPLSLSNTRLSLDGFQPCAASVEAPGEQGSSDPAAIVAEAARIGFEFADQIPEVSVTRIREVRTRVIVDSAYLLTGTQVFGYLRALTFATYSENSLDRFELASPSLEGRKVHVGPCVACLIFL